MDTTLFILLSLFVVKHFVADFVLQFDYMLAQKGTYGARGGIDHAAIHALLTVFVVSLVTDNWFAGVTTGVIDGFCHYHIDWLKQQLNRNTSPDDRKFWLLLGADQALHYLTYIGIIGLVTL